MEFFLLNALLKVFLFLKVCDSGQVEQEAMVLDSPKFYNHEYCSLEEIFHSSPLWLTEVESRTQGSRPRPRTQKKSEAKDSLSEDRLSWGQGQECSRPSTKDTSACALQKKGLHKNFSSDLLKKRFPKNFSTAPQNFNNSKNSAVLKPRTGQFSRTWGFEAKAKDLTFEAKVLKNVSSRPRTSSRTPPLMIKMEVSSVSNIHLLCPCVISELSCCCCSAYLSSCHRTASDANLLDDLYTFHYQDYFVIGGIRTSLGVSDDPMFLWISLNSCPLNLLLVRSHQAEIIIVKRLIQGRNNVTRVRVEPRSFDQGRRKNDAFTHSATLPTRQLFVIFKTFLLSLKILTALHDE